MRLRGNYVPTEGLGAKFVHVVIARSESDTYHIMQPSPSLFKINVFLVTDRV